MLENDLDEINTDFFKDAIISFDKPEINYNKLIDKLELSISIKNIVKLKEICLNVLTNMKPHNFIVNFVFYIFIGGKHENRAIHRIKGNVKLDENLLFPKNKTIVIKNISKISSKFKFYCTYEITSQTNIFRGKEPLFTPAVFENKNEFDVDKFISINFINLIPNYEPKLPNVKYNELRNQLIITIPKKQLDELEKKLIESASSFFCLSKMVNFFSNNSSNSSFFLYPLHCQFIDFNPLFSNKLYFVNKLFIFPVQSVFFLSNVLPFLS